MNKKTRFVIAAVLSVVILLTAAGAWAAPKFAGTVPQPPTTGGSTVPTTGGGETGVVDMGTALFTPQCTGCTITVNLVDPKDYPPAPEGKKLYGDMFLVTANPEDIVIKVCYAYPPEFADNEAKIYRLNAEVTPNVWVEVPGAVVSNGTLCVDSTAGVFALFGNP